MHNVQNPNFQKYGNVYHALIVYKNIKSNNKDEMF